MTYKGIEYCDECGGCLCGLYYGEENEDIYYCDCKEQSPELEDDDE